MAQAIASLTPQELGFALGNNSGCKAAADPEDQDMIDYFLVFTGGHLGAVSLNGVYDACIRGKGRYIFGPGIGATTMCVLEAT